MSEKTKKHYKVFYTLVEKNDKEYQCFRVFFNRFNAMCFVSALRTFDFVRGIRLSEITITRKIKEVEF